MILAETSLSNSPRTLTSESTTCPPPPPIRFANLLLTVLAGVARFTGGAAVPTSSQALTGAGEPGIGERRSGCGSPTLHPDPALQWCPPLPHGTPSLGLEWGHPHVLWVGQWAGTGLAVLRCPGCSIPVVAGRAQLTEFPSGVVLALLRGTGMSATHQVAKSTPNCTML